MRPSEAVCNLSGILPFVGRMAASASKIHGVEVLQQAFQAPPLRGAKAVCAEAHADP